jgi:sterol desaturase/sphingolipid hydroxylase (fatty acid hydroxylase superfamily)
MFDETLRHLPLALQILLGLLLVDFSTYWRHRFTHKYMWQYHAFHHSAEEITWITSLRLHPVDYAVAMLVDTIFLYFLGFGGQGIAAALVIAQVYNYFTHLDLNVQFKKPLCYVLASPHYHRWHHATDKSAYDKNFCGIFSFLDVIFGTYHHPDELPKGLWPFTARPERSAYGVVRASFPANQKRCAEIIQEKILEEIFADRCPPAHVHSTAV